MSRLVSGLKARNRTYDASRRKIQTAKIRTEKNEKLRIEKERVAALKKDVSAQIKNLFPQLKAAADKGESFYNVVFLGYGNDTKYCYEQLSERNKLLFDMLKKQGLKPSVSTDYDKNQILVEQCYTNHITVYW